MQSRYQAGDEENGSFGATRSKLQDLKPGVEAATPRGATTEGKYRRNVSKKKYQTVASLADRIRERGVIESWLTCGSRTPTQASFILHIWVLITPVAPTVAIRGMS